MWAAVVWHIASRSPVASRLEHRARSGYLAVSLFAGLVTDGPVFVRPLLLLRPVLDRVLLYLLVEMEEMV